MVSLAGELLTHAESLLRMGLHISDIINGFEKAGVKAVEILRRTFSAFLSIVDALEGVYELSTTFAKFHPD